MEMRELRSFCTAARLRSISRAAESLEVGQPTVTMHIKKLERELGVPLFDRVRRPIRLTLAGEKLAQLATPLVEGIDGLAASTARAEEEGPITVASVPDLVSHFLLRALRTFRAIYPQVHLRIRSRLRSEVAQMVAAGEVDFGIIPGPERDPELEFQGLFPYERVLITPLGHPILKQPLRSIEAIADAPLIMMGPRTYTRTLLEAELRRKGLTYDIVVELDSMDQIKQYVALGMGVSVVPRIVIERADQETLGIVELGHLLPTELAGMVTLRGKTLSAPTRNFITVVADTPAAL